MACHQVDKKKIVLMVQMAISPTKKKTHLILQECQLQGKETFAVICALIFAHFSLLNLFALETKNYNLLTY